MQTFYEVITTCTSKPMGAKSQGYQIFDDRREVFKTIDEVKKHLKEIYGKCKRSKLYIDQSDKEAKHSGYVYHFNNKDYSHDSSAWHQQDWVSIYKTTRNILVIK